MTLEALLQGSPNTIPFIRYPRGTRPKTYHTIHFPKDFDQIPSFLQTQGVQAISYPLLISRPDLFLCEEGYDDTPFPLALLGLETQLKKGHRCIVCGLEPDVTERAFKFAMQRHLRHVHFLELGKTRRQVLATCLAMEREEELNKLRRADELELRKQVKRERRAALRLARKEEKEVRKLKEIEDARSNKPMEQADEREAKRIKTSTPPRHLMDGSSHRAVPALDRRLSRGTSSSIAMPSPAFEPGFTPASASLEAFANTFARIVSSATNLPAAQQTDFSSYICTFDTPPAQFQSAAGRKRKLDVFLENSQPHGPPNHLLDDYSYVFDVPDSTFITLTQPWLGHKRSFPSAGSVFNQGIFSDDEANKWMTCTRTQNQDSTDESGAFPVYDPSPFFPDPFFSYV